MQRKFNNKSRILRLLTLLSVVMLLGFLLTLFANLSILAYSKQYIYEIDDIKMDNRFDTIIVLGAGVYSDGTPCPMLQDRLDTGIILFNDRLSNTILLTGDHGRKTYDEVNGMKQYVFKKGLNKENVFLDHAGFSTYESMYRADYIYQVKSALVVTQEFHMARSVFIARKMGIEAYGVIADRRVYPRSELLSLNVREYFARVKDFLLVTILKPLPTYLGDQIPIDGKSDITYDYIDETY
ncbi:MAG: YdcF family protein [Clostridia bacterium]|nr:YdcF family protein [Clostridia bacterium]